MFSLLSVSPSRPLPQHSAPQPTSGREPATTSSSLHRRTAMDANQASDASQAVQAREAASSGVGVDPSAASEMTDAAAATDTAAATTELRYMGAKYDQKRLKLRISEAQWACCVNGIVHFYKQQEKKDIDQLFSDLMGVSEGWPESLFASLDHFKWVLRESFRDWNHQVADLRRLAGSPGCSRSTTRER